MFALSRNPAEKAIVPMFAGCDISTRHSDASAGTAPMVGAVLVRGFGRRRAGARRLRARVQRSRLPSLLYGRQALQRE